MFHITFHKEPYRNIVAVCLLTRISTLLYSDALQAGDILVNGEGQILGAFKKIRKKTISLVASLRPSVCLRGRAGRPLDGFSSNLIFWIFFPKICPEIPSFTKIWPIISATLPEQLCAFMIICGLIVVRMRNVADKIVQKIQTHILCSITLFPKSCCLWDNVGKCCRAGQDNRWQ